MWTVNTHANRKTMASRKLSSFSSLVRLFRFRCFLFPFHFSHYGCHNGQFAFKFIKFIRYNGMKKCSAGCHSFTVRKQRLFEQNKFILFKEPQPNKLSGSQSKWDGKLRLLVMKLFLAAFQSSKNIAYAMYMNNAWH